MSKRKHKSKAPIIAFTILLTVALVLAGVITVGIYIKNNEPERYETLMREIRNETTEPETEHIPATNSPITTEEQTEQLVSLIIPKGVSDLIGGINSEKVNSFAENADGSYTIEITKEKQLAILNDLREQFDNRHSEIITNGEYSYVTGISRSDDFTMFTITSSDPESLMGGIGIGLLTTEFKIEARSYQVFNGQPEFAMHVSIVDESGNVFIEKYYSNDDE